MPRGAARRYLCGMRLFVVLGLSALCGIARAACPDFATAVNYAAGTKPAAVAVGDVNRDGKLDLAVANTTSENVSILLGYGNGTFHAPTNFGVGHAPAAIAIADLSGDGKLDLAVAN